MNEWVSLHHHTTYSFQDGYGTPEQHLQRAHDLGYDTMAFSEHGNVSSHFRAEKAAGKTDVRPLFGIEAYTGPVTEETKKQSKYHLILLAMDSAGYRNLNSVVTQSWLDFYYYPTVGGSSLARYNEGLICLSGCTGSLLACTLVGGKDIPEPEGKYGDVIEAMEVAARFQNLFGDRYYLEVQGFPELEKTCLINPVYERMGRDMGIPLVATMDCHYPMPDDNIMQQIIHAADRGGKTIDQQGQTWEYDVRLTLPPDDNTLYQRLKQTGLSREGARSAIENSRIIANRCQVTLPKVEPFKYPVSREDWDVWPERR
jgi:DNA polymerase-3 subunit alpha